MAKRFYAVRAGRAPGIYHTWDDCKKQVDGFPGAQYKGFATEGEARSFIDGAVEPSKAPAQSAQKSESRCSQKTRLPLEQLSLDTASAGGSVIIYTDGSCLKNPGGPGGYAAVIQHSGTVTELVGSEEATTNNRMEMKAAIEALRFFAEPTAVALHTDSQYLRKGFAEGWVSKWKRNGWVTQAGTTVLNQELWQELDRLNTFHQVVWRWVKGHDGNPMNERCDELAVGAATQEAAKIGWKTGRRNTAR